MRHSLILGTAFCLLATAASAGGNHDTPQPAPKPAAAKPAAPSRTSTTNNAALAGAAAAAAANSHGGTGGLGGAGGVGGQANNGGQTLNYSGGNYSARGNTPDVILGSVSGGNPCGLGAGAGGSGPGAGGVLSFMWEGDGCETREAVKLLHNLGYDAAAKNRACQDTRYSNAFAYAGDPCAADVQRWQAEWRKQGYRQVGGGWTK